MVMNPSSSSPVVAKYTSDSEEDDLQPPRKMQRRRLVLQYSDDDDDEEQGVSISNSKGRVKMQGNSDDENRVVPPGYSLDAYKGDLGDSDDSGPENDDQLLHWSPPMILLTKIYTVDDRSCNETERRKMLDDVGCEDRFIACSLENSCHFYARWNKEEANKVKGVKGIFKAIPYRCIFRDD